MEGEKNNGNALARLRTLFALERNYLAILRTYLAQIRTGLALALFSPPVLVFLLNIELSEDFPIFILFLIYIFLITITIFGSLQIIHGRASLKEIRRKIRLVREKEIILIEKENLDDFNYDKEFCKKGNPKKIC